MKVNKGNPPSIGWWPTGSHALRWWDGEYWSWPCLDTDNMSNVRYYSSKREQNPHLVTWRNRPDSWPERSKT